MQYDFFGVGWNAAFKIHKTLTSNVHCSSMRIRKIKMQVKVCKILSSY